MRHKYTTTALLLARTPHAEASATLFALTPDLGLIRVRAQAVRKPGAKLASAVQTFAHSDLTLVRAKDGWRLTGAILVHDYAKSLEPVMRTRVARVAELFLRFVQGDSTDARFYYILDGLLQVLPTLSPEEADAAECIAVLRLLVVLGLDVGALPIGSQEYAPEARSAILASRSEFIKRINHGIEASGL